MSRTRLSMASSRAPSSSTAAVPSASISDYYDPRRYEARGARRGDHYDPLKYAPMTDTGDAALDDEDERDLEPTSRSDADTAYQPLAGNDAKTHEQWMKEKAAARRRDQQAKQHQV